MPAPGETITGPDGKVRVWQPDTRNSDTFDYLGPASGFATAEEAHQADLESGQGSYVPGSFVEHWPWWLKAFVATGLGSAAVTGIGAAVAPGLFGATPVLAGTAPAATSTLLGATPSIGIGAAPAAIGTGAAATGTAAAATPTALGVGAAPTSSLIAGSGPSIAMGTSQAAPGAGGFMSLFGPKGSNANRLFTAGQLLTNYSQGAAQGRQAEANLNLNSDALRQRQAESERQNAIDRAKLEMDQRVTGQNLEDRARYQAGAADFMKAGPYKVSRGDNGFFTGQAPTFEHTNEIADQSYRDAMQRLLSGSDKQFTTPPTIPTPSLTPQPNEGWLDKLVRWTGTGASLAGVYKGYTPPPPTTGGR